MVMRAYLGTSGWHYHDWVGPVYPREQKEREWLANYSRIFNFTNINVTFYQKRIRKELVKRWYNETPPNFKFVIKANQEFTHRRPFNAQEFSQWTEQFQNLQEKLLGFLLQFPKSVHRSKQLVSAIKQVQCDSPVFVEFREKSWYFPPIEIDPAILVIPDTPRLSTLPGRATSIGSNAQNIVFIRLHGRNRFKWYNHNEARERYDYYYPPPEITYIIQRMTSHKSIIIIDANNHPLGQAPLNMIDAKRAMGEKISKQVRKLETRIMSILAHRLHREKMGQLNAYFGEQKATSWKEILKTDLEAGIRVATPYVIAGVSEGIEVFVDRCEKRMYCEKPNHKRVLCEHLRALLKAVGKDKPHVVLEDFKDVLSTVGIRF